MKFSLKDLFLVTTAACLYAALYSIVIDIRASMAAGVPLSGFRVVVLLVAILVLFGGAGAVVGGLIGMVLGSTKRWAILGAIAAIFLMMLLPAIG
jgi:hypothetical protein